jgi:YVTN family beta-propeller protein
MTFANPARASEPGSVASADVSASHTIAVGTDPVSVALDEATHTAYVGNSNTVSVINTATCNATRSTGCDQTPPIITVGPGPVSSAVDVKTDTVYVTNLGSDTVSVIDGATCNATVRSGCVQTPAAITVGNAPDGVVVDERTDTVYVANNADNTISVINGATCNAETTSGCGQVPPTVAVGVGPGVPALNAATDTVYVPDAPPSGNGSVSVIDAATCNAQVTSGCGQTPPAITVGPQPYSAAVDQGTDTVYVTSLAAGSGNAPTNLGSVFVINGATCNATVTIGCGQTPPAVTVGANPDAVAVDSSTKSVFVVNQDDSTISVIDGAICNAVRTVGCDQSPPQVATGPFPGYLGVAANTDTVYVTSQVENDVLVLDGAACSVTDRSGCRQAAPTTTVGAGPQGIAVNQKTETVYVASHLAVIDGKTCNATVASGCGRTWPTVATGNFPQAVAVDQRTDTVYVANSADNTISVINGATCNAEVSSGCDQVAPTVSVGTSPSGVAINEITDTIYVTNQGSGTVSVIDGATCNASDTSGCGLTPPTVTVREGPMGVAVDPATDTVYVSNTGTSTPGHTVSVIDGATCNATVTSGCGQRPPTVSVGSLPDAVAVDQRTDTVYVATGFFNPTPTATMAVIDGATCNATVTSGCGQKPAEMRTGGFALGVAVDQATDLVYAVSVIDSNAEVFDGTICDATHHSGCGQAPLTVATGGWPTNVAVNARTNTVYVTDNVDGQVPFFRR